MNLLKQILLCPYKWLNSIKHKLICRRFSECGNNLEVCGFPKISCPSRIKVGANVNLNDGCVLNATESSICIGNNCTVSANAMVIAATLDVEDYVYHHIKRHIPKPVHIGDNVWICAGAIICPGVRIVGGVIIAAGAVVTKDIEEENVLVAGNPAKIVKRYNQYIFTD